MSSESSTAFYKGVKFWLVLLLAAGLAALLWRMWRQEPVEVAPRVGCVACFRVEGAETQSGILNNKDAETQRPERSGGGRDRKGGP